MSIDDLRVVGRISIYVVRNSRTIAAGEWALTIPVVIAVGLMIRSVTQHHMTVFISQLLKLSMSSLGQLPTSFCAT
jgi:hypothetical protein